MEMITSLLALDSLVLVTLLILLGAVVVNLLVLPRLRDYRLEGAHGRGVPRLAALVPARNEEVNIEACLRSLLSQDYPEIAVRLYDDASTDATYSVATGGAWRTSARCERLEVVRGAGDVWRGYSKNTYAFFGYNPLLLAAGVVSLALVFVAPPLLALYALLSGELTLELFYLPASQYLIAVLTRALLAVRFAGRAVDSLLHPAAVTYMIAVLLNSMLWRINGKSVWKGRSAADRSVTT